MSALDAVYDCSERDAVYRTWSPQNPNTPYIVELLEVPRGPSRLLQKQKHGTTPSPSTYHALNPLARERLFPNNDSLYSEEGMVALT